MKRYKRLLLLLSIFLLVGSTQQISAISLIEIEQPCNFVYDYSDVNDNRGHWDGDDDEIDLGANKKPPNTTNLKYQSCHGEDAIASISGSVITDSYGFNCSVPGMGYVVNPYLEIHGDNNISVRYTHQASFAEDENGDVITNVNVGDYVGDIGSEGCSTFKHIHFDVRKNGVRQDFSKWEFAKACAPPESGDWIITDDCVINETVTPPANVEVRGSSNLTVGEDGKLDIDFENYSLVVKNNSTVITKEGGKIT